MDDLITIPRASVEALLEVATGALDMTDPAGPQKVERAEVAFTNNKRKHLAEAVYQAEKALFDDDVKPLTAEQMSDNAARRHGWEDDFSDNKTNFIEGRR